MIRSISAAISILLIASCIAAGPPTRPNEREWSRLAADAAWVRTLREAAPAAAPALPRKQRIENALRNLEKLEPALAGFLGRVKEYYERTGDLRAAKLYASEQIEMGDDYLELLSRFDRAILMYQRALTLDPTNEEAKAKLAAAEQRQYVAEERFGMVQRGMREADVERILGLPREDWIKQVVQNDRAYSVWIYPRVGGSAAAIYFDDGVVYHASWNAAPGIRNEE